MPTKKQTPNKKTANARRVAPVRAVKKTVRRAPAKRVAPVITVAEPTKRKMVGPLTAIANFWRKYFEFKGRATRSEFWFALLFVFVVSWAFTSLAMHSVAFETTATVVNAVLFIPFLTVSIRRFRDAGVSVWLYIIPMLFVYLIPIIRAPLWTRLIMMQYVSSGMLIYSLFLLVYTIFCLVVMCLPSRKQH